jgi:hypothetical protein
MGIDDAIIRFGKKYNGTRFDDVPVSYLKWLLKEDDKNAIRSFGQTIPARDGRRAHTNAIMSSAFRVCVEYHVEKKCGSCQRGWK